MPTILYPIGTQNDIDSLSILWAPSERLWKVVGDETFFCAWFKFIKIHPIMAAKTDTSKILMAVSNYKCRKWTLFYVPSHFLHRLQELTEYTNNGSQ